MIVDELRAQHVDRKYEFGPLRDGIPFILLRSFFFNYLSILDILSIQSPQESSLKNVVISKILRLHSCTPS